MANSTKEKIVDCAIALIASDGLRGMTQRKVASLAGTSLASVTYYFPKLEDLIDEAFNVAADRYIAQMWHVRDEALAQRLTLPEAYLQTILDAEGKVHDHVFVVSEMIIDAMKDDKVRKKMQEFVDKSSEFNMPWLQDKEDSYFAAYAFIGASMTFLSTGMDKEKFLAEAERMLQKFGIEQSVSSAYNS